MLADQVIGRVGARILKDRLSDLAMAGSAESAARIILDRLAPGQIVAVVRAVKGDPELDQWVDCRIPQHLVEGFEMPSGTMIEGNTATARNLDTDRLALLTASGGEATTRDTAAHVTGLGAKEFRDHPKAWAEAATHVPGITPTPEDMRVFQGAIKGLFAAQDLSLHQAGEFCAMVVEGIRAEGYAIRNALGWSLPQIELPRDTSLFTNSRTFATASTAWRKQFEKLFADRSPLLKKLRKTGQPIDATELQERYESNEGGIAEHARPVVQAFIQAPPGDSIPARALMELEWERDGVHLLFDRPREKQKNLAESTLDFFEDTDPERLTAEWRDYLEELKAREKRTDWSDTEEQFFEQHRAYLEEEPKLRARWEKVVFGKPVECIDFLDGLVTAVHRLIAPTEGTSGDRFLQVRVRRTKKDWKANFNYGAGGYFSTMYRGLAELLGERVEWKIDNQGKNPHSPLFNYPDFFYHEKSADRSGKLKQSLSVSRAATQIKFEVSLIERRGDGQETALAKTQLIWSARPEAIGQALREDLARLLSKDGKAGFTCTEVPRRLVSRKGAVQSVSLLDVATLEAGFGRDPGTLVPPTNRLRRLPKEIAARIDEMHKEGRYSDKARDEIRSAWEAFEADYIQALKDFFSRGLHSDSILRQADAFAALLRTLLTHARGDVCRARLVSEVLSGGTVRLSGETPTLIIPPWHPERMKALAVKLHRTAGLIGHMLMGENVSFGDRKIFFREFSDELEHPFYPEIAVATHQGGITLLAETATVNGYSLMEPPVRGNRLALTDVLPGPAAKEVRELLQRYVALQPHEAHNLSVLLYDADAATLPLAVVRELAGLQTDGGFQCNVAVRHRDPAKLRGIYVDLVAKADTDPDVPVVSETADNFMSKLRVSVSPPGANPPRTGEGFKPFDVAFLHDVVARTAIVEWIPIEWATDSPDFEHAPSRWSYRSVSGEDELKAASFLTCPRQTRSGRAWVDAVGAVVQQRDFVSGTTLLPARRISLQDGTLHAMLQEAHDLAEWVATYDELLDKRQLRANGITVVRYRRQHTNGRNVIVSSTSDLRLLGVLIRRRIQELGLTLSDDQIAVVSERLIKDSLDVSGDIVLRAAKRGVSAGELIGLVMSRWIVEREFATICGEDREPTISVFYLLDDYAAWLAQQENRLADLLGLCVEEDQDGIRLHIAVVESKYVSAAGAAEARRSSKTQLLATLSTLDEALFGDPGRLDRDLWLARLSDMLLDAPIQPRATGLLERARSAIREGAVTISMRGYSHLFIHTSDAGSLLSESQRVPIESRCLSPAYQEVFDRPELRRLVESYARGEDPVTVRSTLGTDEPWKSAEAHPPARRTTWTEMVGKLIPAPHLAVDLPPIEEDESEAPADAPPTPIERPQPAATQPTPTPVPATPSVSMKPEDAIYGPALAALIEAKAANRAGVEEERAQWAEETTRQLKAALNGYGLQAQVLGTRLTPNGCLVRLAGSDRLRVPDIEARRMQLLTTHGIRLVTVQPKPGEIVVTIAGDQRQAVSLWDVWAERKVNRNQAGINTSFVLGVQELNGAVLYLNLGSDFGGLSQHEPHSLIAGATGSGKSVLVQAILLDIAATNPPSLAKIVLIDPKMGVDYTALDTLPHLREPVVTDKERAVEVLSSLVEEMEDRYRAFAAERVRDLASFNAKVQPEERMPMVFLVHDEFADWMLDAEYKAAVSAAVQRLGVKARAAGIHIFFAAQRPDKDVMPMQLRDNLGNRLILKVASEATSKIVLDRPGAEQLLGRGHLAARLNGEQGLVYAQAPFLSDGEIAEGVRAIAHCGTVD